MASKPAKTALSGPVNLRLSRLDFSICSLGRNNEPEKLVLGDKNLFPTACDSVIDPVERKRDAPKSFWIIDVDQSNPRIHFSLSRTLIDSVVFLWTNPVYQRLGVW